MKKVLTLLVLTALLCMGCAPTDHILVISNATIIDGTGAAPRPGMTVVIDRGRISRIGESGGVRYPRSARVIDGTGKYLIPGLWDMHVHLRDLEGTLPLFVVNGVTTVRDMGSAFEATTALREQVAAGTLLGPRIKTPGRMLESTEWLNQYVDLLREQGFGQQAGTEDERNRYVSNGIRDSWRETMAMNAADESRPPREVIRHMVTTSNEFLRQAREAGVLMMAGTDAPTTTIYFGFSLHDELRLLVDEYGMTPMESLQSATSIPAAFMGMDSELGTIESGKIADMVLLDADPLADIANTREIDTIIIGGRAIDRAERERVLGEIATTIANR